MYDISLQTRYIVQPKTTKNTYQNDVSNNKKIVRKVSATINTIQTDTDSTDGTDSTDSTEIEPKIYNMTETRVPNYTKKAIMDYQRRKYASGDEEYRRKMSEKAKRYYQRKKAKKEALEQSMISV
jgi:hypothetical protein